MLDLAYWQQRAEELQHRLALAEHDRAAFFDRMTQANADAHAAEAAVTEYRLRAEAAEVEVGSLLDFLIRWRYRQPECPWCYGRIHTRDCELIATITLLRAGEEARDGRIFG